MAGDFALRSHTADVAIEATGASYAAVFGAVADGLAAAHVDELPEGGEPLTVSVTAESRTALLFDYLDRLLYVRDVEGFLAVDNEVSIEEADAEWRLEGTARGIPVAGLGAREVKAITYSEMDLSEQQGRVHAYVVVDV
jgi:SHS2 domain-containing protein